MALVFVNIVTFNSASFIEKCLNSVFNQNSLRLGDDLLVQVIDNASHDSTWATLQERNYPHLNLVRNSVNLGFAGAHNQGLKTFMATQAEFFLVLNPDLVLDPNALIKLISAMQNNNEVGLACPLLYRANDSLEPHRPGVIDACGMHIAPSLRHFDIHSGEPHDLAPKQNKLVFGGSGACLLLGREFILDATLEGPTHEHDLGLVYPELHKSITARIKLFDEAFFAYREDADLAWRAQILGWQCLLVVDAIGFHRRLVLPERRQSLAPELNRLGVRNRFLLQLNNYSIWLGPATLFCGIFLRNFLVIIAVLTVERTSISALGDVIKLWRRARERRNILFAKRRAPWAMVRNWFRTKWL